MPTEQVSPPVWSDAIGKEVIAAFTQKSKQQPNICPICRNINWHLQPGFVFLPLQEQAGSIVLGGKGLPCIAISCTNCGNTLLVNIIILGLKHLLEKPTTEQKVG